MHPIEIRDTLASMVVLVDSREKDTPALGKRLNATGRPVERVALTSGDYSCKIVLPDGTGVNFSNKISIERKLGLVELCTCFCKGRERFTREFERMKAMGGRMYLLVENASWEDVYSGRYRSQMNPNALVASILAWQARYQTSLIFCKAETSGKLIGDILYREAKEALERGDFDTNV